MCITNNFINVECLYYCMGDSFEREFPGLCGSKSNILCDNDGDGYWHNLWCEDLIGKCCLDKERVRQAVIKFEERIRLVRKDNPGLPLVSQALRDLLKELGL